MNGRPRRTKPRIPLFEGLEPRLLLSSDLDAAWQDLRLHLASLAHAEVAHHPLHEARHRGHAPHHHGTSATRHAGATGAADLLHWRATWAELTHPAPKVAVTAAVDAPPVVSVLATTPKAFEKGQPGVFTITHSGGPGYLQVRFRIDAIGVDPNVDDILIDANNNVIYPAPDHTAVVSIPYDPNSTSTKLTLVEGDDAAEGADNEQVQLTILDPLGGGCCGGGGPSYTVASPSSNAATITLVDNDVNLLGPTGDAHAIEGSPGVPQDFTLRRTGDPAAEIVVELTTWGSTAVPGTTYDYSAFVAGTSTPVAVSLTTAADSFNPSGSVQFPAGVAAVTLRITPTDPVDGGNSGSSTEVDLRVLDTNSACCCFGGMGYGYGADSPGSAKLTIDDPDGGTPLVSASSSPATAVEDGGDGIIDIKRNSDDGTLQASFTLATLNGAVPGVDYTLSAVNSTGTSFDTGNSFVTFGAGTTDIYVHVTARDNPGNESPGKGVTLAIKSPPSGCCCCGIGSGAPYALGSSYSATVTLGDAPLTNGSGVNVIVAVGVPFTGIVAKFKDTDTQGSASDTTDQITWNNGDSTLNGTISTDQIDRTLFDVSVTNKVFAAVGNFSAAVTLIHAGIATQIPFLVKVAPAVLQSVAWVAQPGSPLDANSSPGGGMMPGGGSRIYPDQDAGNNTIRSIVGFQAKLTAAKAGVPIYFKVVDIDDPSANRGNDPMGIVDNENNPSDNRGDGNASNGQPYLSLLYAGTTDSTGQVSFSNFRVSMQPGDNYRVVASLNPIGEGNFTAIPDDTDQAGIDDNTVNPSVRLGTGPGLAIMSNMLTVWRRLWVQTDTMGVVPPGANKPISVNVVRVQNDTPAPGESTLTTDTFINPVDNNAYESGTFTDSAGRTFKVVSNQTPLDPPGSPAKLVVSYPVVMIARPAPGAGTLVDDDTYTPTTDLGLPNLSTLTSAMSPAYVTPLLLPPALGSTGNHAPFVVNVGTSSGDVDQIVDPQWQSRDLNSNTFWVAYVAEAYELKESADLDPSAETTRLGETSQRGGSLIFKEEIAEAARLDGNITTADKEADTVVHEIAHAVGNIQGSLGVDPWPITLYGANPSQPSVYSLKTINAIRKALKPWS